MHSITRIPVPYSKLAMSHRVPSICASNARISDTVSTTGSRGGLFARTIDAIQGRSRPNTSRHSKIDGASG